jgi:hypothetical protein
MFLVNRSPEYIESPANYKNIVEFIIFYGTKAQNGGSN